MSKVESAVPVLQVADVERSSNWYASVLGFVAESFPESPPYTFAILRRDGAEVMLQRNDNPVPAKLLAGWRLYLRWSGGQLLELAEAVRKHAGLERGPERMFYGDVEFDVADPDGHVVCCSEPLPGSANVPHARET